MENDKSKHLENFKVQNFKGLESLELNDIKQFNLILGDNNVGKTSVLEALLFDETPYNHLMNLYFVFCYKSNIVEFSESYVDFFFNKLEINFNYITKGNLKKGFKFSKLETNSISKTQLESLLDNTLLERNNLPKDFIQISREEAENSFSIDFRLHKFKITDKYLPFVKAGLTYQKDLIDIFSRTVNSNIQLKQEFINYLQIMSVEIHDVIIDISKITGQVILLVVFKNGENLPLFMMGDGTIRLIRLILEIILCKNNRLMIDEIDNGLHFSRMKEVWTILLKVAVQNNTQLFITTHDAECLRAFKEVLEIEEMKHLQDDVASYTLFRNKENVITSVGYNFKEFEHAIDYSLNIRG